MPAKITCVRRYNGVNMSLFLGLPALKSGGLAIRPGPLARQLLHSVSLVVLVGAVVCRSDAESRITKMIIMTRHGAQALVQGIVIVAYFGAQVFCCRATSRLSCCSHRFGKHSQYGKGALARVGTFTAWKGGRKTTPSTHW